MPEHPTRPTCFIAMPVTTHDPDLYRGDSQHWLHVMETLFVKAVEQAGFTPITPVARGTDLIHAEIIRHLEQSEMVLCDLSSHNPNVFFELGVRTSLDKPIALVKDELTARPFDTAGLNTYDYQSSIASWAIQAEIDGLARHIADAAVSCAGRNPLWRHFGLTQRAVQAEVSDSVADAQLRLIFDGMNDLRSDLSQLRRAQGSSDFRSIPYLGDLSADIAHIFHASASSYEFNDDRDVVLTLHGAQITDPSGGIMRAVTEAAARHSYELVRIDSREDDLVTIVLREMAPWRRSSGLRSG